MAEQHNPGPNPPTVEDLTAPVGTPLFINGPYTITPLGHLRLRLSLHDDAYRPVPEGAVLITLPDGAFFDDGSSGVRSFVTDAAGFLLVEGIQGPGITGRYTFNAQSGSKLASASLAVVANGPDEKIPLRSPQGSALTPDGTRLYVCAFSDRYMAVLDTLMLRILYRIVLDFPPLEVVINPQGTHAYVSHQQGLLIITLSSLQVISMRLGRHDTGLVLSPDGRNLCFCVQGGGVAVLDTLTQEVDTVEMTPTTPNAIVVSPDNRHGFVCSRLSATLSVIDILERRQVRSIPLIAAGTGMAISPDGALVYINLSGLARMAVFDTASNQVSDYILLTNSLFDTLAASPDGNWLYTTNGTSVITGFLAAIDTSRKEQVLTLAGEGPRHVSISPDGTCIFVSNRGDNTLQSLHPQVAGLDK
ncbi:PD40 domain-containing protein [Pseudomonas yamanorum]|uniref:YncE family protein n=1 Tax=Pseudomonas yamanorum TaxID=515393 RepID=UPI00159F7C62|nr:PD40 domain-containing protein [Pseudomonas yamanorum]NWE43558.1 PD40 domain-containing protein [Pseudomonas yamanorum]